MYVYVYRYIYMYVYSHIYIYICMCIRIYIYIYIWIWRPCRMVMDIYREIHMYTIYYIYTLYIVLYIHKCIQTEREKRLEDPRCLAPRPWCPSSLHRPPNLGPWKPRWIPEVEKGTTCREKILENFINYIYMYLYVYIFYLHIYCTNIYIYI